MLTVTRKTTAADGFPNSKVRFCLSLVSVQRHCSQVQCCSTEHLKCIQKGNFQVSCSQGRVTEHFQLPEGFLHTPQEGSSVLASVTQASLAYKHTLQMEPHKPSHLVGGSAESRVLVGSILLRLECGLSP